MADKKKQKLTPEAQDYQQIQKQRQIKRPLMKNCLKAFIVGGSICLLGQFISTFYMHFFDFTELTVGNPTIATLIIITMFLTGFGIYDHFGNLLELVPLFLLLVLPMRSFLQRLNIVRRGLYLVSVQIC